MEAAARFPLRQPGSKLLLGSLIEASPQEFFAAAVEHGMRTLGQAGSRLCVEGVSSLDEIRRVTGDRVA